MNLAFQIKMTPANILVQPPGRKTSQIIQYSNLDMKNHSSNTLCQNTLVSDTFEHSINEHSMSDKNDSSQHSGLTSGSKNVTNHTIFQPR